MPLRLRARLTVASTGRGSDDEDDKKGGKKGGSDSDSDDFFDKAEEADEESDEEEEVEEKVQKTKGVADLIDFDGVGNVNKTKVSSVKAKDLDLSAAGKPELSRRERCPASPGL